MGTKITNIWELKLQKSKKKIKKSPETKSYNNSGTKVTKIWEQKFQKIKNMGTNI
jgi:hypothetical protein